MPKKHRRALCEESEAIAEDALQRMGSLRAVLWDPSQTGHSVEREVRLAVKAVREHLRQLRTFETGGRWFDTSGPEFESLFQWALLQDTVRLWLRKNGKAREQHARAAQRSF